MDPRCTSPLPPDALRPLLERAGALAMEAAGSPAERKADRSYVTAADIEVGRMLTEACKELVDAPVVQEEGEVRVQDGLRWVVDPIDGTTNFARGSTRWCVSIALCDGQRPLVGGVIQPATGGLWVSTPGSIEPCPVEAWALAGRLPKTPQGMVELARRGRGSVRITGAAALDLIDLARGQLRQVLGFGLGEWDFMGAWAVLAARGGVLIPTRRAGRWDFVATGATRTDRP